MKLLTKTITSKIPALGSQDGLGLSAIAYAKFFTPTSSFTWYATEFDGDDTFFGLVESAHDQELGYFSLSELQALKLPFGLKVERDMYFTPTKLKEIYL